MTSEFKNMAFKQKREYIWDYYKLHIFGVIIVLVIISSAFYSRATSKQTVLNVSIITQSVVEEKRAAFQSQLENLVIKDGKEKKEVQVDLFPILQQDTNTAQYIQKLQAQMAAGDIDLLIMDKGSYETLLQQGSFHNLETITSLKENNKSYEFLQGEENSVKGIYAIDFKGNKYLSSLGIKDDQQVAGIILNSKRKDNALAALNLLLSK